MQINPQVLKEKEIEEAKAVLEKHGLLSARDNQSRSDSVILFGDSNKKRDAKVVDKQHDKLEE
jgi:hypothetical protein